MTCDEFELIILALARNQLMDAGAHEAGLVHAKSCGRCAARLTAERFLIEGVRAAAAEIATDQAPAHVEVALLAAFQQQVSAAASPSVVLLPIKTNSWSFWRTAAVAASILILISAMAIFWSYSNSLKDVNEILVALPVPVESPAPVASDAGRGGETAEVPINLAPPIRRHQRVSGRKSSRAEVVTEFYSLVDDGDLDSSEFAQVVRVELPASALSAAGITVNSDISTLPVKADVALGYDGMARAIRFVR